MQKHLLSALLGAVVGAGVVFVWVPAQHLGHDATSDQVQMNHYDGHTHEQVEIFNSQNVPTIEIEATADAKDGYNINIVTQNFIFTPSAVGSENSENAGHAHLYIGERKVARVYSNWFHLSADALQPGANVIMVSLNANDHREWASQGVSITDTTTIMK